VSHKTFARAQRPNSAKRQAIASSFSNNGGGFSILEVASSDFIGKCSIFTMFSSFFVFSSRTVVCPESPEHFANCSHVSGEIFDKFSGWLLGSFSGVVFSSVVVGTGSIFSSILGVSSVSAGVDGVLVWAVVGVSVVSVVGASFGFAVVASFVSAWAVSVVSGAGVLLVFVSGAFSVVGITSVVLVALSVGVGCCFVGAVLRFGRAAMAAVSWLGRVWV